MEIGPSNSYQTTREKLRWTRYGNKDHWETITESESSLSYPTEFYRLCPRRKEDPMLDKSGKNGIVTESGSLDLANKTASVSWSRPFDVSSDKTLTLVADQTYKVWLTWGNFRADYDIDASYVSAKRMEKDGIDLVVPAPPEVNTNAVYLVPGVLSALTLISLF